VKPIKPGRAMLEWNKMFLPPFIAYYFCLSHYRRSISVSYESPFFWTSLNHHSRAASCGCHQREYYFLHSASMNYVVATPAVVNISWASSCWQPRSLKMYILMLLNQFLKLYVYNTIILLFVLMCYLAQYTVMNIVRDI
jgi:hypothetical protein